MKYRERGVCSLRNHFGLRADIKNQKHIHYTMSESKIHLVRVPEHLYEKLERLQEETGCKSVTEMLSEIVGYYTKN